MILKNVFVLIAVALSFVCSRKGPDMCTMQYDPYCGSDGVTYGNYCLFLQAKEKNRRLTATKGECSEPTSS